MGKKGENRPPTKRRVDDLDDDISLVLDLRHRAVLERDLVRAFEDHCLHRVFGHCPFCSLSVYFEVTIRDLSRRMDEIRCEIVGVQVSNLICWW